MRIFLGIFIFTLIPHGLLAQDTTQHYTLQFSSSNIKVLSDAYLHYGSNFNDIYSMFRYDSTLFNERYNDTCYIKTTLRKEFHNTIREGELGDYYYSMEYGFLDAKITKVKLKNEKFWALDIGKRKYKENEEVYQFDSFTDRIFSVLIFPNMQSKNDLKEFLNKYEIGDHRIYYDALTNTFELELKTRNNFVRKTFFPFYPKMEEMNDVEIADMNYEKFKEYAIELSKKEDKFNRDHIKDLVRVKRDQQKIYDKRWKNFQKLYMSEEEKRMSQEDWMKYYQLIIQDEFRAVMNSEPKKGLFDRYLMEMGYRLSEMDLVNPNTNLSLKSEQGFVLIDELILINLSKMYYAHALNSIANNFQLNFTSGDRYALLIKTKTGEYGIITTTIPENKELVELEFKSISKDLVSIEMISKKAGL
ncbi:MAG: hypothetical protein KDC84_05900 [Crocinitomicaceae bacterium]|nr:hypothetical protein [Crocinitomicaceae bacterium]